MEKLITFFRDKQLGSGGYRSVYLGTLHTTNGIGQSVDVAVKRVLRNHPKPECMKREVEHLASLDHPNVVRLLRHEFDEDFLHLALELCQASLQEYCSWKLEGKYYSMLRPPSVMLLQMARGLEYIHSKKLVHRDIKPSNILIWVRDQQVVLKIADFGFSKVTSYCGGSSQLGCVKGTNIFKAPELLNGSVSERGRNDVDVFALGCVFYCFLTTESGPGKHPFGSINWDAITLADEDRIKDNIRGGKSNLSGLENSVYKNLVEAMIREKTGTSADCRINIQGVVRAIHDTIREWPVWKRGSVILSERYCYGDDEGWINDCAFDQTGSQLACALNDGTMALFQGDPGVPFNLWSRSKVSPPMETAILRVAWNVDGSQLAAGCRDGTLVVWKRSGDEWVQCFTRSTEGSVNRIKWNAHSPTLLATVSLKIKEEREFTNVINVWDVSTSSEPYSTQRQFRNPLDSIVDIIWINSQDLVFGTSDGKIELQTLGHEPSIIRRGRHDGQEYVEAMRLNREKQQLAACSRNGTLRIWELKEQVSEVSTLTVGFWPFCIDWYQSADKSVVAVGGENGSIKIFSGTSFEMSELKHNVEGRGTVVEDVRFSSNGQYLAVLYGLTAGWEIAIWFVDSTPVQRVFQHKLDDKYTWKPTFSWSPTGEKLAVGKFNNKVLVLETPPEP